MMKKVVLICVLVMLVSIIPAFTATSDTPIKKPTKLKIQLKTHDCSCIETQKKDQRSAKDQIKSKDQIRTKSELKNGSCNTT